MTSEIADAPGQVRQIQIYYNLTWFIPDNFFLQARIFFGGKNVDAGYNAFHAGPEFGGGGGTELLLHKLFYKLNKYMCFLKNLLESLYFF